MTEPMQSTAESHATVALRSQASVPPRPTLCATVWFSLAMVLLIQGCGSQPRRTARSYRPVELERAQLYVYADGGFGGPTGLAGVGVGVAPHGCCMLEVGTGVSDSGLQFAGMAGFRGRVSPVATLGLSSGLSVGPWIDNEPDFDNILDEDPASYQRHWDWVLWSNTEMHLRRSVSDRLAIRAHIGLAVMMGATEGECRPNSDSDNFDLDVCHDESTLPDMFPYIAGGVEYAF